MLLPFLLLFSRLCPSGRTKIAYALAMCILAYCLNFMLLFQAYEWEQSKLTVTIHQPCVKQEAHWCVEQCSDQTWDQELLAANTCNSRIKRKGRLEVRNVVINLYAKLHRQKCKTKQHKDHVFYPVHYWCACALCYMWVEDCTLWPLE